jgi:hypothetical protein
MNCNLELHNIFRLMGDQLLPDDDVLMKIKHRVMIDGLKEHPKYKKKVEEINGTHYGTVGDFANWWDHPGYNYGRYYWEDDKSMKTRNYKRTKPTGMIMNINCLPEKPYTKGITNGVYDGTSKISATMWVSVEMYKLWEQVKNNMVVRYNNNCEGDIWVWSNYRMMLLCNWSFMWDFVNEYNRTLISSVGRSWGIARGGEVCCRGDFLDKWMILRNDVKKIKGLSHLRLAFNDNNVWGANWEKTRNLNADIPYIYDYPNSFEFLKGFNTASAH